MVDGNKETFDKKQEEREFLEQQIKTLEYKIQHMNTLGQDTTAEQSRLNLAKLALSNLASG